MWLLPEDNSKVLLLLQGRVKLLKQLRIEAREAKAALRVLMPLEAGSWPCESSRIQRSATAWQLKSQAEAEVTACGRV